MEGPYEQNEGRKAEAEGYKRQLIAQGHDPKKVKAAAAAGTAVSIIRGWLPVLVIVALIIWIAT